MTYTMQLVRIPGAHASGIDVSVEQRSWLGKRSSVLTVDDFPTANGTDVSAGGCRT